MAMGILDCFMISFVCGVMFGMVYEIFRFIRRIIPYTVIIMACDICFFVAAGFFVFELSMYLGNYIRLYTLLGFGAGIFAYIQTIGRIVSVLEIALIRFWASTVGALISRAVNAVTDHIRIIAHNITSAFGRFHDFFVGRSKSASSLLHFNTKRVYNVKRNIESYGENIGGNNVIQVKIRRSR